MRRILLTGTTIFVVLMAGYGQSEATWNLEQCIDHAIDYNLEVKRQELALQSTGQDLLQSRMNLLPVVGGNMQHQLGSGRVLDYGSYEWKNTNVSQGSMAIGTELTLFSGLQSINSMKMYRASYMKDRENLEAMEDLVTLQVMTGYLDLLRNEELVTVEENKVEVTAQQVARMEQLVEVGNEPKGKLLEVNAQLSAAKLALTQAINNREIARLNLMHVMNLTDPSGFMIERPLLPDPSTVEIPQMDAVFSYAVENLPQVKSASYEIESQEKYLAIQRGQRSPRLMTSGYLYTNYSDGLINPEDPDPFNPTLDYPIWNQLSNNRYRQAQLSLQIPFFNKWQVQTSINKAKISLQDAHYQYSSVVLELQQRIQQSHAEALAARDNYLSAMESVANSTEAYRFAEERFRVGTGTALELQEARNQLFQSTADMISSRYALIFYMKILDFYMGREITL